MGLSAILKNTLKISSPQDNNDVCEGFNPFHSLSKVNWTKSRKLLLNPELSKEI